MKVVRFEGRFKGKEFTNDEWYDGEKGDGDGKECVESNLALRLETHDFDVDFIH